MAYLSKLAVKDSNEHEEYHNLFNVHATMLLHMSEALMSSSLASLSFE